MASTRSMSRPPHVSKKAVTVEETPATPLSAAAQETTATVQAVKKSPRELRRLLPITISGGSGARADRRRNNGASATAGAERAAKAWMRRALAKRVATRMLKRSTSPPAPPTPVVAADEGSSSPKKVIACCCARLPPGLRCALHQDGAPGRCWMRAQRRGCSGGDGGECREAVAPPKAHGWAFSEYARWRRHVWMPSRFYSERVEAEEHRAAAERARLRLA